MTPELTRVWVLPTDTADKAWQSWQPLAGTVKSRTCSAGSCCDKPDSPATPGRARTRAGMPCLKLQSVDAEYTMLGWRQQLTSCTPTWRQGLFQADQHINTPCTTGATSCGRSLPWHNCHAGEQAVHQLDNNNRQPNTKAITRLLSTITSHPMTAQPGPELWHNRSPRVPPLPKPSLLKTHEMMPF